MNRLAMLLSLLLSMSFGHNTRDIDLTSCRVQLSCAADAGMTSGISNAAQGRPGKRGPAGIRGPPGAIGLKGSKGEPCDCRSQLEEMRNQIHALELLVSPKCPKMKFIFRNSKQTTDWIKVKIPVEQFSEATTCVWISPKAGSSAITGASLSYATRDRPNEFLLYLTNAGLAVHLRQETRTVNMPLSARSHVCVVISREGGTAKVFQDGAILEVLSFSNTNAIEGGGSMIIGQEQDSFFGGFVAGEAFSGIIEDFMMWYRTLDDSEISTLYNDRCSCPLGYAISLTPDQIQFGGKVESIPVGKCSI